MHKIIWEEYFPVAFAIGISIEEFKHMTPIKLGYCLKGYRLQRKMRDEEMWLWFGNYALSSVAVAVDHNLRGDKAKSEYMEHPIMREDEEKQRITEEEKQRQVDLFFARENARRANWKRHHKKTQERKED